MDYTRKRASLVAQMVKNLPAMRESGVQSLGWEDPLEKGKATHSSILAWRIPWTVWSMGSQTLTRLSDFNFHFHSSPPAPQSHRAGTAPFLEQGPSQLQFPLLLYYWYTQPTLSADTSGPPFCIQKVLHPLTIH